MRTWFDSNAVLDRAGARRGRALLSPDVDKELSTTETGSSARARPVVCIAQALRLLGVSRPTNPGSERPALPVTEYERHRLFTWFEEHMGRERAATMMNLVPPAGWAEVASQHDLDELEARLTTRIDALESRMNARFEALENRVDSRLEVLRSELLRTFGTWLFASQAAVITAISVVIALVAVG